jgi:putative restriction endonuclease
VTVGLLHTGRHYPDDLLPDGIIYHFPSTESPGKDAAKIEATKNAGRQGIPLFVVVQRGNLRDVHLGVVEDFDDADETFLVRFVLGDEFHWEAPEEFGLLVEGEFVAFDGKPKKRFEIMARERDPRFAFKVKKRSGSACAVCKLRVSALIDAAHVIPVKDGGSNHPANGIPLCATHHRAFDAGLFTIHPDTLEVVPQGNLSLDELRISASSVDWLPAAPNQTALAWHYKNTSES